MAAYAALPLAVDVARSVPVLCDLLFVMSVISFSRSRSLWTAFMTRSSVACTVGVGSEDDESCQSWYVPLHPSHQLEELSPLMGVRMSESRWSGAREQKKGRVV